jgi:hypothetical protein
MSNPFYPPRGMHTETSSSRGNIGTGSDSQPIPFDPDRRGDTYNRSNRRAEGSKQFHPYQHNATQGPGGATLFYSQDAPVEGDMPVFGTGTD